MPVGDVIHESGLLIDGPNGPLLKPDKGGTWQLEPSRRISKLIGNKVHVEAVRSGFSDLAVKRIWLHGTNRPLLANGLIELAIVVAFVGLGYALWLLGYFI
jgi:Protein of unknown function (DUF5818)